MILDMFDYFNAYSVANAMVPGRVEQWVSIVDAENVGLSEIPLFMLANFAKKATLHFKQRNGMSVYINMHWMLRVVITLLETILDEFQLKCNAFFSSDYESFVEELIGLENV